MPESQSVRNHTRWEPRFHFFVAPVLLINVIVTMVVLVHHWPDHIAVHVWLVVMAIALLLLAGIARAYALRVQDRVIRLEERMRYLQLLTPEAAAAAQALSVKQILALRFASDAELPALTQRAVAENLPPKAIKEAIGVWRPDTLRV